MLLTLNIHIQNNHKFNLNFIHQYVANNTDFILLKETWLVYHNMSTLNDRFNDIYVLQLLPWKTK